MSDSSGSASPSPMDERPFVPSRINRSRRQNVDYGDDLDYGSMVESDKLFSLDIYRWEDDDISLRSAAAQSRLPYDRMTEKELKYFSDFAKNNFSMQLYLYIRNKILVLWHLDPLIELTSESVRKEIPQPFNSDIELIDRLHNYLQRFGFINYGSFTNLSKMKLTNPRRIIVIGAGISGLIAARQLKFFGFDVVVLEGRKRPGGRIMTLHKPVGYLIDIGADTIMGIVGNPLTTLIQQMPVNVVKVDHRCPIYDNHGKLICARKDKLVQRSFTKFIITCQYISKVQKVTDIDGKRLSLSSAISHILRQQEYRVVNRRLEYWKKYLGLCTRIDNANKRLIICKDAIKHCLDKLAELVDLQKSNSEAIAPNFSESLPETEFDKLLTVNCLRQCLLKAVQGFDKANNEIKELERLLSDYRNMEPSHVYMNDSDKQIMDFHFASLEYMVGAPLKNLSFNNWDHSESWCFEGSHLMVKEGFGKLTDELSRDLDIRLDHIVDSISYVGGGVDVSFSSRDDLAGVSRQIQGDAVLCTIPLGVLKRSLKENLPPNDVALKFVPDLPEWKKSVIRNVQFGIVNKIALMFSERFWNSPMFGRLSDTPTSRGELFLFVSNENGIKPCLVGFFCGESANVTSTVGEEIILNRTMAILASIFGNACPRQPVHYAVTKWHTDRFARGGYSYMGIDSNPYDYDLLAKPLQSEDKISRIFFAGEHTCREWPASAHGAFLSGLRAVSDIVETFIGPLVVMSGNQWNANLTDPDRREEDDGSSEKQQC